MWENLSFNEKVSILAGETWIDGFTLCENAEFVLMVKSGKSKEELLDFINSNW